MTFYIGRAGALLPMPEMAASVGDASIIRKGGTHELADGGTVADMVGWSRRWQIDTTPLEPAERSVLEQLYLYPGWAGPLRMIDDQQRNLLTPNQSTCGDTVADITGFRVTAGTVALTSTPANVYGGLRALAWTLPAGTSATGTQLHWTPPPPFSPTNPAHGVPVVPGEPYTFTVRLQTSTGSLLVVPKIAWMDADGVAFASSDAAEPTRTVTTAYSSPPSRCSAMAPSNAVYATVFLSCQVTVSSTVTVYADQAQLEMSEVASPWTLGLGVPVVDLPELSRAYPTPGVSNHSLTVVELSTLDGS